MTGREESYSILQLHMRMFDDLVVENYRFGNPN
jgi:hypothetical protein